jgi:outer membrane protein TolC
MLSVRLPVYVGGRISSGVEAAEAGASAAEAERARARQSVVHAVMEAYTGVALADAHLGVAREAREVAEENARLVGDLREAGLVVQSDVLQAEVRLSEIEEMIARAESAAAVSRASLNAAMGRDLDDPVLVEPLDDFDDHDRPPPEQLAAEARESRPDIRAARRRVSAADRSADVVRGALLPEVGVEGRLEANAEDFIGADGDNWSVFASARWTVFEGKATTARLRRARAEADAARRMVREIEDRAGLEVRTAYHELRAARRSREVAERSVGLAEESLRIVRDRYQEGLTTLVELLDAENALTRARVRVAAAQRDIRIAAASLDLAVGRL